MPRDDRPVFAAPYAPDEVALRPALLAAAALAPDAEARAEAIGRDLVGAIRAARHGLGGVDELLHAYSLSTKEGLALMVLAEALLRVPDAATADRLIEDKLGGFLGHARALRHADRQRLGLGAWALGADRRARRHAGRHPGRNRPAPRQARRARGDAAGDAADGATISCSARRSRPPSSAPPARPAGSTAIPSTCSARAPTRPPTPRPTGGATPRRSRRSAAPPATPPCPTDPASRSSFRRCTRATRRRSARG